MSLAVQSVVQQMFCGDEVKACVVDMGSSQCRFGFAGQDVPRYRFRSDVGLVAAESSSSSNKSVRSGGVEDASCMQVDGQASTATAKAAGASPDGSHSRYLCGDQSLRYIRDDVEIMRPFTHAADGAASINWDAVEQLLAYGTGQQMAVDPREYPLLFAENDFRSTKDKSALLELAFEKMDAPASWIASSAALAAFSSGRTTAMVVDVGASGTRVQPVVDGYALHKAEVRTTRGGNAHDALVDAALAAAGVEVRPWFEASSSSASSSCAADLRSLHRADVVRDVKKWMSFVPYVPVPPASRHKFITDVIKLPPFELPDGTLVRHDDALCTGAEALFFAESTTGVATALAKPVLGLPAHQQPLALDEEAAPLSELLRAALLRSDVDARKDLLGNTCLVGGGALIDGLQQRLQLQSSATFPAHMKCKVQMQLPEERLNAAWIGGSILGICGSFQQMWISKQEWLEYGDTLFTHRLH